MLEFMKLEMRKGRLIFLGLLSGFLTSLAACAPVAVLSHGSIWDAMGAVLIFWTLAGIPAIALMTATAAGASLREDMAAGRETALPLSPGQRMACAIAGAGGWTILLAGVVLLLGAANEQWRLLEAQYAQWRFYLLGTTTVTPWAFLSAVLLVTGASAACAVGNAVLGALLALFYGVVCCAGGYSGLRLLQVGGYEPLVNPTLAVCAVALAGAALAAWQSAPAIERASALKGRRLALCLAGLIAPLLAGPLSALTSRDIDNQGLHFVEVGGEAARTLAGRRAQLAGALVSDARGALWRYAPSQKPIQLLPPGQRGSDHPALAWDQHGALWVLLKSGAGDYSLWTGDGSGPLSERGRFQAPGEVSFRWLGRSLGMETHKGADDYTHALWSALAPNGRLSWQPLKGYQKWQPWSEHEDVAAGAGAVYTDDYWHLRYVNGEGKTTDCRLPGPAENTDLTMPDTPRARRYFVPAPFMFLRSDGELDYLVGVRTPRRQGVAACGPGGKARLILDGVRTPMAESGVDGSVWYEDRSGDPLVLSPDGHVSAPLRLDTLEKQRLLRADSGKVWFLENDSVVHVMDASDGRELSSWRLPRLDGEIRTLGSRGIAPVADGLFVLSGGRLYFIGWDGGSKDLGPA